MQARGTAALVLAAALVMAAAPAAGAAQGGRLSLQGQVRAAIAAALRARHCDRAARRIATLPADGFAPPVAVTAADPGFRVEAIRADRAQHRTRFRLRATRAPKLLPFWISLPGDVPARATASLAGAGIRAGTPAPRQRPGPLLVRPHRPALLVMLSPGMRIALVVIPLQQGRRGQLVQVEDPANHRFLTARVSGKNRLEAEL